MGSPRRWACVGALCCPLALLLLPLLPPLCAVQAAAQATSPSPPPTSPPPVSAAPAQPERAPSAHLFPPGRVSPLLRNQRLSHYAFHAEASQVRLARLAAPPPATVVIVGVEWGSDAIALARAGYRVVGVEPLGHFVAYVEEVAAREGLDVRMVHAAAAAVAGETVTVNYENAGAAGVETVATVTVDEVLEGEPGGAPATVAVLAVDIQGDEAAVVAGAARALGRGSVASVWAEAIACNERVRALLAALDPHFSVFDWAPWGAPHGWPSAARGPPATADAFVAAPFPTPFEPWWTAMCDSQRLAYTWLQTDLVGIRRDRLTNPTVRALVSHGEAVCGDRGLCLMRAVVPRRVAAAARAAVRGVWDAAGGTLGAQRGLIWGSLWGRSGLERQLRRVAHGTLGGRGGTWGRAGQRKGKGQGRRIVRREL